MTVEKDIWARKNNNLKRLGLLVPEGVFMEIGVYSGKSAKAINEVKGNRKLYFIDSFEGMPEPKENDIAFNSMKKGLHKGDNFQDLEKFKEMFKDETNVIIIKRWIEDSMLCFVDLPENIALLHIDTDFEDSYRAILKYLYPRVVNGGAIVFDDYNYYKGAKMAVDDFIKETGETLHLTEGTVQAYIVKGAI